MFADLQAKYPSHPRILEAQGKLEAYKALIAQRKAAAEAGKKAAEAEMGGDWRGTLKRYQGMFPQVGFASNPYRYDGEDGNEAEMKNWVEEIRRKQKVLVEACAWLKKLRETVPDAKQDGKVLGYIKYVVDQKKVEQNIKDALTRESKENKSRIGDSDVVDPESLPERVKRAAATYDRHWQYTKKALVAAKMEVLINPTSENAKLVEKLTKVCLLD